MIMLETIEKLANRILEDDPDPVVRFRLLRDVLKVPPNEKTIVRAKKEMLKNRWVSELERQQEKDGGWGRFHSSDSRTKREIKTTEIAVDRGLALGLDVTSPIFQKTVGYLSLLLDGSIEFPDPPERNDRWLAGKQLFVAATLAKLQPSLSVLDPTWQVWVDIVTRTFASGRYDAEAEVQAHAELTGASVRDSYLVLNNRYALALLGSRASKLPSNVEKALATWIWQEKKVIGYLGISLTDSPIHFSATALDHWFTSLELLSSFPSSLKFAKTNTDWLWTQRNKEGLWDFGHISGPSRHFPLSENWRKKQDRIYDYSTRVLTLLRSYHPT